MSSKDMTEKPATLDDANHAIRVLNQLRDEAHEVEETYQKLLDEIKSLKAEKNELREEKLALKAEKEKTEQQLKAMMVPSTGFMPQIPAPFNQNKMAVYQSYGYMPMWHNLPQSVLYLQAACLFKLEMEAEAKEALRHWFCS